MESEKTLLPSSLQRLEIFFDIDGCLIDETYKFTLPVSNVAGRFGCLSHPSRIHLNSNRSLKGILPIWEMTKPNGLIIYENGLGVFDPRNAAHTSTGKAAFNRSTLIKTLMATGDNVKFINTGDLIKNPSLHRGVNGCKVFYCEESREFTATVYPRIIRDELPTPDLEFVLQTYQLLADNYSKEYDVRKSDSFYNILITPRAALKSNPMSEIAGENRIASFGDDEADIQMFKKSTPGLIGCPANAKPEVISYVRSHLGFIAQSSYTRGVIQFLDYLDKKNGP